MKGATETLGHLLSNEAINKINKFEPTKGILDIFDNIASKADGESVVDAILRAQHKGNSKDNPLSVGRIAGSVIGASAATRIVTGGGVYKDKNGNTNVIGIPFV